MHRPDLRLQGAQAAPSVLVGRARERQTLGDLLASALAGRGELVLIAGAAGIGKTTLAAEVCQAAVVRGGRAFAGRCYDLIDPPPYGPWRDFLARYAAERDGPPLPAPFDPAGGIGAVGSQAALFSAMQEFIATLAARAPCVIVLDDLHWADPVSLDLLRFIARDLSDLPVLIIATYRGDELAREHPFYRLVPALVREAGAARLDLRPLHEAEVRALIAARYRLPDTDAARLVAYIQGRAQGNPFFLGELLRTLEDEGVLAPDGELWSLGALETMGVPALLQQVIEGRLARVDDETRALLAIGALIGHEAPYALWAAAANIAEDDLPDQLAPAVRAALITESDDGMAALFAHALIRQVLYESLPPSRRRRLHRQVAERLAASSSDPDTIAHHLRQAGDARAVEWLVAAGEQAERAVALFTAAERYEAALTQADTDSALRPWIVHGIARTRRYVDPRQGLALLDLAMTEAAMARDPAFAGAALRLRGLLHCYVGEVRDGLTEMERAIPIIRTLVGEDRARFEARLGGTGFGASDGFGTYVGWLGVVGRSADVLRLGEGLRVAMAAAPDAPRDPGNVIADSGLAPVYAALGMPEQAREAWARYRAATAAIGDHAQGHSAWSYEAMFVHLAYAADDRAARRRLYAETERARTLAHGTIRYPPNYMLQSLLFVEGKWDEIAAITRAVRKAGVVTQVHLGWACVLGPLARARGDRDGAWAAVRSVFPDGAIPPGETNFLDALPVALLAATLAIEDGDLATARAWLEMHDHWLAWSGAVLGAAEGALAWSVWHVAAREPGRAVEMARAARQRAETPRQPLALLAAHRRLGELACAADRHAEAATDLDAALALAVACAAPYERALTLLARAELAAARGDGIALATDLDAARAICAPLGAAPLLARADTLAARLATPSLYPDGLTTREVDVLRALAAGKSNRQIAEALSVSVRTVDRHIANVYLKIDAHNKAEATAYALRHGLTRG